MGITPLGFGGGSPTKRNTSGAKRNALNLKTTKLDTEGRRGDAHVSIGRRVNDRGGKNDPSTSASHINGARGGASSVSHQVAHAKRSIADDEYVDEVRDRMRYQNIRTRVREKKAEEVAATKTEGSILNMSTGSGHRSKGKKGIKRQLQKIRKRKPLSFGSLSDKDLDYFSGLVTPRAKALSRGSRIGRGARIKMKVDIDKQRRAGNITKDDSTAMKRLVDKM
jgi:hypothetical protein